MECLVALGLRGSWGELRGDEVVMLGIGLPNDDTARLEEVLGIPLGAMRFQLAAYKSFATTAQRRTSTVEEAFPSRMISMFRHLNDAERSAVRRHLGPGPLLTAPIEDGDRLLGLLLAWGPAVVLQRRVVENLAAVAGLAWHRVEERPERPAAPQTALETSSDLAAGIKAIIVPRSRRVRGSSSQGSRRDLVSSLDLPTPESSRSRGTTALLRCCRSRGR